MMTPNPKYVSIKDNENQILKLLEELVTGPRVKALEWSSVTHQTPNLKIGYPGQHLASLITGVLGTRTGARGDDLIDGTEIKSCSRVDQLDSCKDCKEKVLRIEEKCHYCGSKNIKRMNDSKWLFSIKSENELDLLVNRIDRVLLIIADYPSFDEGCFDSFRIQAFEIWVKSERSKKFKEIMTNYYNKIFLKHIKINPNKTPAPKNFWPYSFQFYQCAPLKVFSASVKNANTSPTLSVDYLFSPLEDRSIIEPERMPINVLNESEVRLLLKQVSVNDWNNIGVNLDENKINNFLSSDKINMKEFGKMVSALPFSIFNILPLRDTDQISVSKKVYRRR